MGKLTRRGERRRAALGPDRWRGEGRPEEAGGRHRQLLHDRWSGRARRRGEQERRGADAVEGAEPEEHALVLPALHLRNALHVEVDDEEHADEEDGTEHREEEEVPDQQPEHGTPRLPLVGARPVPRGVGCIDGALRCEVSLAVEHRGRVDQPLLRRLLQQLLHLHPLLVP